MIDVTDRVPAKGCNGPYEINRLGEVFNGKTGRKLKLYLDGDGYLFFDDYCNGVKKIRKVAIISALTFVPNPENKRTVNHINGIKIDNRPENLEWMTHEEQMAHAKHVLGRKMGHQKGQPAHNKGKKGQPRSENSGKPPRPVRGTYKQTGEVREFESIHEAARQVGGDQAHICKACQGKYKSSAGYRWEYID